MYPDADASTGKSKLKREVKRPGDLENPIPG